MDFRFFLGNFNGFPVFLRKFQWISGFSLGNFNGFPVFL